MVYKTVVDNYLKNNYIFIQNGYYLSPYFDEEKELLRLQKLSNKLNILKPYHDELAQKIKEKWNQNQIENFSCADLSNTKKEKCCKNLYSQNDFQYSNCLNLRRHKQNYCNEIIFFIFTLLNIICINVIKFI